MEQQDNNGWVHHIEIMGDMDRHAMEALYLEVRQLAKQYGVKIKELRIGTVPYEGGGSGEEETAG